MRAPTSPPSFPTIELTVPFRFHRLLGAALAIVVAAIVLL